MHPKRLFLYLLCFITCHQALAKTYYVDSKRGNDAFAGTSRGKAFKTLEKVNSLNLEPGDEVLFRRGTSYAGALKISASGQPGKTILFSAYGRGSLPRIDGQGLYQETVLIRNSSYLRFENFEITNQGSTPKPRRMGLHILLEDFGIARQVQISGLYVHDVNGSNIKKEGGGAGIHWTNRGKVKRSAFDGLLIEGCKIERTDRNGITSSGFSSRDNWFPSRQVVIRHNYLHDIGGDGIVPIGCDGAIIEYNVLHRGGQRFPQGDAAAGIWPWSCDNTLVQYNEVAYYAGPWDSQGFDSDWNCRNSVFQYNYSHDNDGGFMLVCSPTENNGVGNRNT
ncbi:MAG: right-handed parallel beta-helix repeat-containing protein, partial [Adhaeribacter sp.]